MAKKRPRLVPNRVKEFRDEKTWTKVELAREAKIAPATLNRMEAGLPTREHLRRKIAKALGLQYETVFPNDES